MFQAQDGNPQSFRWGEGVLDACRRYRQGDVVVDVSAAFSAYAQHAVTSLAREVAGDVPDIVGVRVPLEYAMITSQTCDLSGKRGEMYPLFSAAPVYDIIDAVDAGLKGIIRKDKVGQFIRLDGERFCQNDQLWVADLRFETSMEKGVLAERVPINAFANENGYLRCARKIARVRARAAVDDDVEKCILRPLGKKLKCGEIPHDDIIDILVKATPTTVKAQAVRLYVLLDEGAHTDALQQTFDDWHVEICSTLPVHLTLLGIDVRPGSRFTWIDYQGAELVDFDYLSPDEV